MADADIDEDDIPSLLGDMESRGDAHVFSSNDLGTLSSPKAPTSTTHRGLPVTGGPVGVASHAVGGVTGLDQAGAGLLVAVERQRLEVERQRLAVESERLLVEKERLAVERERLRHTEVERERLQLEREKLHVDRERLRLLLLSQSERVDSSFNPPQQGPPSSSTATPASPRDCEQDGKGWAWGAELETERVKLEKERLQLEKERLQFFKFESGRLQVERERLQVEKERLQLQQHGL